MTRNIGREDRLVRAGVTFSLLLMAGFAVMASGAVEVAVVAFGILAGWFLLTAAVGWDPIYARLQVDTRRDRSDDPWAGDLSTDEDRGAGNEDDDVPSEIDLREPQPTPDAPSDASRDS
jgi:hypothetical protein